MLNFHKIRGPLWWKVAPQPGTGVVLVDSINSSGSLIPRKALEEVGPFDARMFIDHVETEWCFRAIGMGYEVYAHQNARMEHCMGDRMMTARFIVRWSMPYRSARRHYTIFRNSLYLQRKAYVPRVWKFWNLVKLAMTYVLFGLFGEDAKNHRQWIYRGIEHGRRQIMGPYPNSAGSELPTPR